MKLITINSSKEGVNQSVSQSIFLKQVFLEAFLEEVILAEV